LSETPPWPHQDIGRLLVCPDNRLPPPVSGGDRFMPAIARHSGTAMKIVAQGFADDLLDLCIIAATRMVQGIHDFGWQGQGDMHHAAFSP
jgi:hypothetical protein